LSAPFDKAQGNRQKHMSLFQQPARLSHLPLLRSCEVRLLATVTIFIPPFEATANVVRVQTERIANRHEGKEPAGLVAEKPLLGLLA